MKKITVLALGMLLSLAACGSSFAQDRTTVSALSNGLGVISSGFSGETAAACLFIKTGSAHEPAGKSGITALLCSSVLSSNPVDNADPPSLRIEQAGGKVTADVEADYTCLTIVSPAASFPAALKALAAIVSGGYFSDTAVQIEKGALLSRNDLARDRAEEKMYHALFPSGLPGDIEKLSRKDLLAWRTARFRPDESLLSVCGPFSSQAAIGMAEDAFKDWKAGGKAYSQERPPAFKPDEVVDLESAPGTAGVLFACKFPSPDNPEYCAALTARAILSGGMSSKVYKSIRGEEPKAYQSGNALLWKSASPVMTVYSVTDETNIDGAIEGIKGSVKAVEEGKFSPEELSRGKAFALGEAEFLAESAESTARYAGLYAISGAGWDYRESLPKQFLNIGKDDVVKAAEKYFNGNALVVMRPAKEQ
ncbi:MAG: pitrilysin family protein [Nitrospirota bacterium]